MASFETLQQLAAHPDWLAPRSDLRVFLGEPGAPEATKTTVEPGNVFSPGMRTFGVTWWLRSSTDGPFFATETAPLETLRWSYESAYLPLLHCDVETNGLTIRHSLFQDGTHLDFSEAVCGQLHLANTSDDTHPTQLFIALRSLGPAGGPLPALNIGADGRTVEAGDRKLPLIGLNRTPSAFGCGIGDPFPRACVGVVPDAQSVVDSEGWCYAVARFDLTLAPGESWQLTFDCPQHTYGNLHNELPGTTRPRPDAYVERAQAVLDSWRRRFDGIQLDVPDRAFHDAFFAGLGHMLTAVVGDQARIAPLSYPLPWLRDSVFIIRSFDLAGLTDLARTATDYCARNDFFGGFGAEGDAPSQGIWALVGHYRLSQDKTWLREVFPAIQRKVDWLFRMRRTTTSIRVTVDTPVLAFTHAERAAGIICLAAEDGIIRGSMDHGVEYALGWVNHWALAGLREAAFAARELGAIDVAERYAQEAAALYDALMRYAANHPGFWAHERTVNSLLWPTRAWESAVERARAAFSVWWHENRTPGETFTPEPYWLYFEFAQAHNALLLGERQTLWQVLDYRLAHPDLPGLYGWREGGNGVGTENAVQGVTLINQLRGCQKFESITPHGWSQAEMFLLQRAVLIDEWQDGLLLFAGVPDRWLRPGARVAFDDFPTAYGKVSATLTLNESGTQAELTISGARTGTPFLIRLAALQIDLTATAQPLSLTLDLSRLSQHPNGDV